MAVIEDLVGALTERKNKYRTLSALQLQALADQTCARCFVVEVSRHLQVFALDTCEFESDDSHRVGSPHVRIKTIVECAAGHD